MKSERSKFDHMTNKIIRLIMFPIFHLILKKLIKENYKKRVITKICRTYHIPICTIDGKEYEDKWYWADSLAANYGYFIPWSTNTRLVIRCLQVIKERNNI